MLVKGRLERGDGDVLNVVAERLEPFPVELADPRTSSGARRLGCGGAGPRPAQPPLPGLPMTVTRFGPRGPPI